ALDRALLARLPVGALLAVAWAWRRPTTMAAPLAFAGIAGGALASFAAMALLEILPGANRDLGFVLPLGAVLGGLLGGLADGCRGLLKRARRGRHTRAAT